MGDHYVDNMLTIARIVAIDPGKGAFGRLVGSLRDRGLSIFVESVLEERFAAKLLRMGFTRSAIIPNNYYLVFNTSGEVC